MTREGIEKRAVSPTVVLCLLAALAGACREARPGGTARAAAPAAVHPPFDADTRRFALVIGHNRGGAGRLPLRFAETDAQRISLVLRELGNFRNENVHLLRAPAVADVEQALGRIQDQIQAWRRERAGGSGVPGGGAARAVLLVYFSGHSDGKVLELAGQRLEHSHLLERIAGAGAELQVIVVDACRSGTLLAMKGGAPGPGFSLEPSAEASSGQAILASAGANEEALESAELGGSFFSHHLLSALRGAADGDRDGRITLNEAYAYASARTAAETAGTVFGPQRPAYQIRLSGRGDFALTALPTRGTVLELPPGFDRVLVMDAIRGTVAVEWAPGGGRRLAVPAVPLLLRAWRGGRTLGLRMSLEPGETRKVGAEELVPEPPPGAGPAAGESTIAATPAPEPATPIGERDIKRALAQEAECRFRCVLDVRAERALCPAPVSVLSHARGSDEGPPRYTLALDLPSRRSLVRLRFEVCDPRGMWLHVADSPTSNGAGGDGGQFSNDAELEMRATGLWVWGNDYGRPGELTDHNLVSAPDFVPAQGCTRRTLLLGDQLVRSAAPPVRARSAHGLRLDPPSDHEGHPDRRWYVGFNRSVGSDRSDRMGSGLAWLEICVR